MQKFKIILLSLLLGLAFSSSAHINDEIGPRTTNTQTYSRPSNDAAVNNGECDQLYDHGISGCIFNYHGHWFPNGGRVSEFAVRVNDLTVPVAQACDIYICVMPANDSGAGCANEASTKINYGSSTMDARGEQTIITDLDIDIGISEAIAVRFMDDVDNDCSDGTGCTCQLVEINYVIEYERY